MRDTIPCPECGSSARITERFWLGSTAGPVEHVRIGCVNNHWLTRWPRLSPGRSPTPAQRPRRPCPLEPVAMEACRNRAS